MTEPPGQEGWFADPESTLRRFYNSIFGNIRNWPAAYSCLSPDATEKFEAYRGLPTFADYWEDKLSFLDELVRKRHQEYPYVHRSCFVLNQVRRKSLSGDCALMSVELVENHLGQNRLAVRQCKELVLWRGRAWLLVSGELEGSLDDVIEVRKPRQKTGTTHTDD